ncbi:MAG TPA: heme exporter protein CcmB [Anaerolineales bacterium]|nr:heme exporter protein CcmB [Anaerolineales bacterium]
MKRYFKVIGAVVWKDLAAELRSRETVSAMIVFSMLMVLVFSIALELNRGARESTAAGVLWATALFSGTLGLGREQDRGTLEGLLLAPADRSALYFGKFLSSWVLILAVQVVTVPVLSVLYNFNLAQPLVLLSLILGTLGYTGVGTLLSAVSAQTRARDVLLPILLLPVSVPVLMAGVQSSGGALAGEPWSELMIWFSLLVTYDVIFLAVAVMVFEAVVGE